MRLALVVSNIAVQAGEQPVGAVVALGNDILATAFTQDRASGRRLGHAGVLAMADADHKLGRRERLARVRLAVNLEPCLMCIGTAMALGVDEVIFGLESPANGGGAVAQQWVNSPDAPFFRAPTIIGGVLRAEVQAQYRDYAKTANQADAKAWAQYLADMPA